MRLSFFFSRIAALSVTSIEVSLRILFDVSMIVILSVRDLPAESDIGHSAENQTPYQRRIKVWAGWIFCHDDRIHLHEVGHILTTQIHLSVLVEYVGYLSIHEEVWVGPFWQGMHVVGGVNSWKSLAADPLSGEVKSPLPVF